MALYETRIPYESLDDVGCLGFDAREWERSMMTTTGARRRTGRVVAGGALLAAFAFVAIGSAQAQTACPPDAPLCGLISPPTPIVFTPPSPVVTLPPVTLPPAPATTPNLVPQPVPEAAERLLALANAERASAGLGMLSPRGDVAAIALTHTTTMAATGRVSHNDVYFSDATQVLLDSKARGENVAENASVDDTHRRLMNSPGHRANILDPRFSVAGFAVVRGTNGQYYTTENFLQPRGGPPVVAPAVATAPARPRSAAAVATPDATSAPTAPPPSAVTVPEVARPAALSAADPVSSQKDQTLAVAASVPAGVTPKPVAAALPAAALLLAVAAAIAVQLGRHAGSRFSFRP